MRLPGFTPEQHRTRTLANGMKAAVRGCLFCRQAAQHLLSGLGVWGALGPTCLYPAPKPITVWSRLGAHSCRAHTVRTKLTREQCRPLALGLTSPSLMSVLSEWPAASGSRSEKKWCESPCRAPEKGERSECPFCLPAALARWLLCDLTSLRHLELYLCIRPQRLGAVYIVSDPQRLL